MPVTSSRPPLLLHPSLPRAYVRLENDVARPFWWPVNPVDQACMWCGSPDNSASKYADHVPRFGLGICKLLSCFCNTPSCIGLWCESLVHFSAVWVWPRLTWDVAPCMCILGKNAGHSSKKQRADKATKPRIMVSDNWTRNIEQKDSFIHCATPTQKSDCN